MSARIGQSRERVEAARILELFCRSGAVPVEADILQPAETLLDLYGEDIRARAFTTIGPDGAEAMLRPDFTVPVVEMHMARGVDQARYAYAGEVFRRQDTAARPSEYLQVGFELFGGEDAAESDAEVFSVFHALFDDPRVTTGDIGLLTAAVNGLATSERRKMALLRHIWRPKRFRRLLDRYGGRSDEPATRRALLTAVNPMDDQALEIGLRTRADVAARIAALRDDAAEPPIAAGELALVDAVLGVADTSDRALSRLRAIAVDLPAIVPALERLDRRLDALDARGIAPSDLPFEASHGRSTMEYYDGFVFSFLSDVAEQPPVATGGRYDALTRVLGGGRAVPAVGGVVRPALICGRGAA